MESLERLKNEGLKSLYPSKIIEAIARRVADFPQLLLFYWPFGWYKQNRDRLKEYKDKYKGKRCFVVCNGPSLKEINFDLLRDEYTFGMNRIYLMKEQNGFMPDFLSCIDVKTQINQFTEDYDNLDLPCFYEFNQRHKFSKKNNQIFIKGSFNQRFQKDGSKTLGNGGSVTYAVIQLAYYMGFGEVYIIGKDHSFNTTEKSGKLVKVEGGDQNHFIKGYYRPGQKFAAPNLAKEERAYQLSREAFEKDGRIIKDATIGGHLQIFEKVDFYSLFPKKED